MKKSHRREIMIARVTFGIFLVVVAVVVALVIMLISHSMSKSSKKPAAGDTAVTKDVQDSDEDKKPSKEDKVDVPDTEAETETEPASVEPPVSTEVFRWVSDDGVRFREQANTDAAIIETLKKGTKMQFEAVEGDWTKLTYNGKTGYIRSDYLTETDPGGTGDAPTGGDSAN